MPHVITGHHRVSLKPMTFFMQYDAGNTAKILSLTDPMSQIPLPGGFFTNNNEIYASGQSTVNYIQGATVFGGALHMAQSTDSGSTFTQTATISRYWDSFIGLQTFFADATNSDICWAASDLTSTGMTVVFYTKDGGLTWTEVDLYTPPAGYTVRQAHAVPAHDGRYGYVVTTWRNGSSNYKVRVAKVDSSNSTYTYLDLPDDPLWNNTSENGFYRGTTRMGTQILEELTSGYSSLWEIDYGNGTGTQIIDGNGPSKLTNQDTTKQIMCTSTGTLLWSIANGAISGPAYLYIYRSTNGGVTWVKKDCSTLTPNQASRSSAYDYIAESEGTLLVMFEKDSGTKNIWGVYSTDDGVTWQQTQVLYPNSPDLTFIYDISGVH